jgi:hypothetical protein
LTPPLAFCIENRASTPSGVSEKVEEAAPVRSVKRPTVTVLADTPGVRVVPTAEGVPTVVEPSVGLTAGRLLGGPLQPAAMTIAAENVLINRE